MRFAKLSIALFLLFLFAVACSSSKRAERSASASETVAEPAPPKGGTGDEAQEQARREEEAYRRRREEERRRSQRRQQGREQPAAAAAPSPRSDEPAGGQGTNEPQGEGTGTGAGRGTATSQQQHPQAATTEAAEELPASAFEQAIQDELSRLRQGTILFNPPATMQQGEAQRIEVRLAYNRADGTADTLTLRQGLQGEGEVQMEAIELGALMSVQLKGSGFDIVALSSEAQPVLSGQPTQWAYDITPLEGGAQQLVLLVSVRIRHPEYGEITRDWPVLEREINVEVDFMAQTGTFLYDNLEWLFTGLLVPIAVWFRRRRKPEDAPSS